MVTVVVEALAEEAREDVVAGRRGTTGVTFPLIAVLPSILSVVLELDKSGWEEVDMVQNKSKSNSTIGIVKGNLSGY